MIQEKKCRRFGTASAVKSWSSVVPPYVRRLLVSYPPGWLQCLAALPWWHNGLQSTVPRLGLAFICANLAACKMLTESKIHLEVSELITSASLLGLVVSVSILFCQFSVSMSWAIRRCWVKV